ncbi:3-keto-disaccharide hydrolase [Alienimonas californiensis]|uniref:3-keto-alpha-glucoside-1,2-lyase/3-keto-2-hydroxy-glucal hydratase domain-containing protein n=1 Tax=Alienimonas californiensis TaxID=2527989 RepID=A0A517P7Q6_9PLAN|nr:DUF1080 domain-containing protein [Alienimonas californiensis]QDT15400.1 hypothetical protein CA12_14850 [Alienimonas californiensis]
MLAPTLAAALVAPALLLAAPDHHEEKASSGATVLFDGSSTDAWEKYTGGEIGSKWVVEDDALHFLGNEGQGSGGDIQTKQTFGDFDLRFEFKVAEGANSGVIYGVVPKKGEPAYKTGPEYQILDDSKHGDGKNPKTSAAALYALYAPQVHKTCPATGAVPCPHTPKPMKAVGEWNSGRIVKTGARIRHYLNGVKVVDVRLDSPEFKEAVANSKFKGWNEFAQPLAKNEKTRIVLQDHGNSVWFRNVTVQKPTLTEDGPLLEG